LPGIVASGLARVEVPAALWRKHRLGELAAEDTATLVEEFEWDWHGDGAGDVSFAIVDVGPEVLEVAARSVAHHPLRAFDAVQLASALVARAVDDTVVSFACFDETLADAARAEGFSVLS
jgi:predicted nucleic acid-binding protein